MRFDSRIAAVVRMDLPVWQRLNVLAFLVSGLGTVQPELVGAPYRDGSGACYLPMFRQPVLVFGADADGLRTVRERAAARGVRLAVYIEEMFATDNDADNRAAVARHESSALPLVGVALHAERRVADRITDGLRLHP
jgi:hypothetical protein